VVPVAHNAGEFWPRNAFFKRPGEVVVSIGPVIDTTGLSAEEINARAEAWVEGEMRRLFPHHYRDLRPARRPPRRELRRPSRPARSSWKGGGSPTSCVAASARPSGCASTTAG
jgi:1-acyl-sn-glycerol-3-phosphate acyltransferase